MLRSVFSKTLWDQRRSLIWWAVGLILLGFYVVALYPYIVTPEYKSMMDAMPDALKAIVGESFTSSPAGYLGGEIYSLIVPLLFLLYAVAMGSAAIGGEEEKGTLDVLLANPIQRWRVLIEKFAALVVGMSLITLFTHVGIALGSPVFGVSLDMWRLVEMNVSGLLLGLAFGTFALALGCLRGSRGFSAAVAGVVGLLAYLVYTFAPLVPDLKPYQKLSPLYYYIHARPLDHGLDLGHAAVLAAISLVCLAIALIAFQRRDIAV